MSNPIRIFVAGDFCCKPSPSLLSVSDDLKARMQSCELRICNFEFPLHGQSTTSNWQHDNTPNFLISLGFDLFTLANNHILDGGEDGFRKTVEALQGKGFGAGTYEEAYQPRIMEMGGKKIAFLSLCFAAKQGVFDDFSDKNKLGCAYLYDKKVNHVVLQTKKEVDFLVIFVHDGMEYVDAPLPDTIARYRDLIDYGADAVVGTHPHCPQGWETYQHKPILYSLGNFFFNSKDTAQTHTDLPHWYEGLCAVLTLDVDNISVEAVPTRNVDNVRLELEDTEARRTYHQHLCQLVSDDNAYQQYLQHNIYEIIRKRDYLILDASAHKKAFTKTLGIWFHRLGHLLTGRRQVQDERLVTMLKDDARRNTILHALNNNK
ncbi:MAG: CapA family protein [Bacteroidales bacterium]|nr:CapA family protein [Bacteroidales bacterium]